MSPCQILHFVCEKVKRTHHLLLVSLWTFKSNLLNESPSLVEPVSPSQPRCIDLSLLCYTSSFAEIIVLKLVEVTAEKETNMGCNKLIRFSTYLVLLYVDGLSKLNFHVYNHFEGPFNFGIDLSTQQICVWLGCKVGKIKIRQNYPINWDHGVFKDSFIFIIVREQQ